MNRRLFEGLICFIAIAFLAAFPVQSEEAENPLALFTPLTGKVWLGHYSDSETEHFNHFIRLTPVLEGKAIRAEKKVPELDFSMETLFFWDPGEKKIGFVSLTNRGQLSKGTVKKENGEVVVIGWSYEAGGKHEYKMTTKILGDGTLEDRFFLKRDGQWSLGHLITYSITTDAEHIGAFD